MAETNMAVMFGVWIFCVSLTAIVGAIADPDFPFRNISLPWTARVDDLLHRLTLADVMFQMAKGGAGPQGGPAPAIPRLGIGPFAWNTECLRGDATAGKATGFAQAIGLAAAFNPKLMHDIASAVGAEVRAKHNDYVKKKEYGDHKGLSCFAPVINIMRHPLWGRNQETYGEDPYLSGVYATSFVQGLQGDNPRYVQASAGCKHFDAYGGPENIPSSRFAFDAKETYGEDPYLSGIYAHHYVKGLQGKNLRYLLVNAGCKHFDVHGGPENIPVSRFSFDAKVSDRDWRLTFLPAFRACVRAGTYSIMCSYNSVNGIPACANKQLLTEILREEWGFNGYVISDEVALEFIISRHHYYDTSVDTAAACVKAGCNLELRGGVPPVYMHIEEAVRQGKLSEDLVRERVKPLFYTRMRLGEFDPPEMVPYLQYNLSLVQSPEHQKLAVQAAMQTFVLLKNSNNRLPLVKKFKKIAIVGPMADNLEQLYGDYAAEVDATYAKTPLQGLQRLADNVGYAAGCKDNKCGNYSANDVKTAIDDSQLVIICIGTGQELEAEGNDRSTMDLPANQTQLIKDALFNSAGKAVILLVFSAGPVNISFADKDSRVEAILQCFFPAQATGDALYNTLTMGTPDASPAGRLPYTWYDTADQIPSMVDYSMEGRTYRYFKGKPLYPFGYGLSYSAFQYVKMFVPTSIQAGDDQYVNGLVANVGTFDAYEVIQVYLSWTSTTEKMPQLQLVAFDRMFIKAGGTVMFEFVIKPEQMAVWTDAGYLVEPSKLKVYVGGQQPSQARSTRSNVLSSSFQITGEGKFLGKF